MSSHSAAAKKSQALRERLEGVDIWMGEQHLSKGLQRDIRRFYMGSWRPAQGGQGWAAGSR